jgi:hypothetical protein
MVLKISMLSSLVAPFAPALWAEAGAAVTTALKAEKARAKAKAEDRETVRMAASAR